MGHKSRCVITAILIISFAWQGIAFACGDVLRPVAAGEKKEIFVGRHQAALRWILKHSRPQDQMVSLDFIFMFGQTRRGTVNSIFKALSLGPQYATNKSLGVATISRRNGKKLVALLRTESEEQTYPQPMEGTSIVYHYVRGYGASPIKVAAFIKDYGFFTLPWRFTFYGKKKDALKLRTSPEEVILAFRIPNHYLNIRHKTDDWEEVLALDPSLGLGVRLPEEVHSFYIWRVDRYNELGATVPLKMLLDGDEAGLLVRVPPEWIDTDETVAVNKSSNRRYLTHKLAIFRYARAQKTTDKLERILRATGLSPAAHGRRIRKDAALSQI
jgi:hypothetical protein